MPNISDDGINNDPVTLDPNHSYQLELHTSSVLILGGHNYYMSGVRSFFLYMSGVRSFFLNLFQLP
jgi:hypothetical protein